MTRALQPSHPDTPIDHRKTNDVDSRLEEFLAPAALLELTHGAGREHKPLRDTCTPACTFSPALAQDCLGCRNGASENDCDFHCHHCLVECASPCNDEDCDIPQACYVEHCPTECQDKDCEFEPCPISTCGASPPTCTKTCFDESCFSMADTSLGFDPQLCQQGACHGLSSCDSDIWSDFSQSHHFSNHFPPSMFTNNTSVWDHSIPQFHGHHSHDHRSNSHTNHKRRRLDGGSSQSSLQSNLCYEASYAWPAPDLNFGLECENSSFSFQPQQQTAGSSVQLENACQSNQYGQTLASSGNYGSDLQASQAQNHQLSFATAFTSPTSNSYLLSPTNFSDAENNTLFSTNGTNPSELDQHVLTDHERQLEGLMCKWKHAPGLQDIEFASVVEHSPYCPDVSSKLTRQRSPPANQFSFVKPETSNAASSGKRSNRQSMEVSTTCQWMISDPQSNLGPHTCDQTFANSKELDEHVQKEHTNKLGAQQFVCGWKGCNTSFKHRGKLNRHISGAHSRYHAYRCSHCDRTFCTKEQLKNHETTHTGEKKYKCQYCDHRSATKTQHNTHERTHTKLKPYACPYCDHRSGDSSNLSKHVKNKHPETRNLPTGHTRRSTVGNGKAV